MGGKPGNRTTKWWFTPIARRNVSELLIENKLGLFTLFPQHNPLGLYAADELEAAHGCKIANACSIKRKKSSPRERDQRPDGNTSSTIWKHFQERRRCVAVLPSGNTADRQTLAA